MAAAQSIMSDKVGGSYFSYFDSYLRYRRMIPFYDAAFVCFVFLDLLTTGIGLVWGLRESAPGSYLLGSHPLVVVLWLLLQKYFAFITFEWLIMRFSAYNGRRDNLIAMYAILTALGLMVSLQNAGHLWRFLING